MNLEISVEEKEQIKARVLQRIENELVNETIDHIRRDLTRESFKNLRAKINNAIAASITDDKINSFIDKILKEKSENKQPHEQRWLEKELSNAILRVTYAHGAAVQEELKNLLFHALEKGFYKKEG